MADISNQQWLDDLKEARETLLNKPAGSTKDPINRKDVPPTERNQYLARILYESESQKGGSAASDYVMALTDKPCAATFPLPEKVNFSVQEIVRNYGSEYKTTGGGKRQRGGFGMENVSSFVKKVVDNRVLDLYLKFLGITLLTPATLVPIALIMGKETFEQVVKDMKQNDKIVQNGGEGFLDVRVPIIDSALIGTGLKLAGLTAINVSPYTLVPLGVLMYIYEKYNSSDKSPESVTEPAQVMASAVPIVPTVPAVPLAQPQAELSGGRRRKQKGSGIATVLPLEYFGRKSCSLRQRGGYPNNNLDTPALREEVFGYHGKMVDNSGISRPYQNGGRRSIRKQRGGYPNSNLDTPALKEAAFGYHGKMVDNSGISRPYQNGGRRSICKQRGGYPNNNLDTPALREEVFGYHGKMVDNSGISRPYQNGGSRTIFGSDIPPNMAQLGEKLWTGQDIGFPRGNVYDNPQLLVPNQIPSQSVYNPPYSQQFLENAPCAKIPTSMAGGKRNSRKNKQYAGASSDWINTLYSRGPVNSVDMDPAQLRMFNVSSPEISNRVLSGGPLPSATYYNYASYANNIGDYKPLYLEGVVSQPANNGESGVFTGNF